MTRPVCVLVLLAVPALAAEPAGFNRDIRPLLSNRCFKCHGPDVRESGLNLADRASAVAAAAGGGSPAIVPGRSAAGELMRRVTSRDDDDRMPPPGHGDPLTPAEIAKLRAWIDAGARYEAHWAYVKPDPALAPPAVRNRAWVRNPVDAFVLARLEAEGLSPAPEADRAVLLRRLSLDLTGLPPTPEDVDAFLADRSPDAYEQAVERLLASPHYGEHQARYWLDQARYADSDGYERDSQRSIWPYRDWVVDALNRDMTFDRFTVEQIAGDLLLGSTTEQKVATGFHRNTMLNNEGGTDDEEFRIAAVVDRVNTTMEVWMGVTIGCAQCHNHKYDPFTQTDYYRLFAFFNNTEDGGKHQTPTMELPTPEEVEKRRKLYAAINQKQLDLDTATPEIAASQVKWEAGRPRGKDIPENIAKILEIDPAERQPRQKYDLARYYRTVVAPENETLRKEIEKLRAELDAVKPVSTLVMRERTARPRDTFVLLRGNHRTPGEKVLPGAPVSLHPLPAGVPATRFGLAMWLIDRNNPLMARVTVNRMWMRYFGRGLVETDEDFGSQGEPPSHPDLLDWLAAEFPRRRYSLKAMHRLIVTSATYRQSSAVGPDRYHRDPFNRLLARGPRLRLDAEIVRDNALAISGLLSRRLGGPPVFPDQPDGVWALPQSSERWNTSVGPDKYRRGLYTFWRRTAPYAAFTLFDAPSRQVTCGRRPKSNTPLQALATLNDAVFAQASAGLARRMIAEARTERDRAVRGFRLCVGRVPTDAEIALVVGLYRDAVADYRAKPAAAKSLCETLPDRPAGVGDAELAAWTLTANALLNLDETITKE